MMKYLLLLSTLTLSLMFSSASSAEWSITSSGDNGSEYYLDLDRIRKNNGYMYVWVLSDYLKPDEYGNMSATTYFEIDCKVFRYRGLTQMQYKQPMGEGIGKSFSDDTPEWDYPPPESVIEINMNRVCKE